jgi:hypothetical protein
VVFGHHVTTRFFEGDIFMDAVPYLAALSALLGLGLAAYFYQAVTKEDPGNERMQELMRAIQEGARAFLRREYSWVAGFVVIMTVLIFALLDYGRPWGAIAYLTGAVFSALAGFVGMDIATKANARTTQAATIGANKALPLAFRGGAVMGFTVAGLALFGISMSYLLYVEWLEVDDPFKVVTAFGLGASSIALFSRVGGGIYTKAADVGADLVGKVEAGIPEDDPRNPATIADNVGDNVGDVAGMGADLFESYGGSIIAPIALAAFLPGIVLADSPRVLRVPAGHRRRGHDRLDHRRLLRAGRRQPRLARPGQGTAPRHQRGHGAHHGRRGRPGLPVLRRQGGRRQVVGPVGQRHRRPHRRLRHRQGGRDLDLQQLQPGEEDRQAGRDRPGHHRAGRASPPAWCRSPPRSSSSVPASASPTGAASR